MIEKIVSGGQTGVDRAALDSAITSKVPYGGWCPKGRIDELGIIPNKYDRLVEIAINPISEQDNYDTRTKCNIHDSDGTLIIVPELPLPKKITDGTILTIKEVCTQKKPYLLLSLSSLKEENINRCVEWIKAHSIHILNVAGPRESNCKGVYENSYSFLTELLPKLLSFDNPMICSKL